MLKIVIFVVLSLTSIRLGFYVFKSEYVAAWPLFILFIAMFLYFIALIMPSRREERQVIKYQLKRSIIKPQEKLLRSRGFPQTLCDLYTGHVQHYPKAIQETPERIPKNITGAVKDGDKTRIIYKLREYGFKFEEWSSSGTGGSEPGKFARLDIFSSDKKVATLLLKEEISQRYVKSWRVTSMDVLTISWWVKDLGKLAKIAARMKRRQARGRIHWQN